MSLNKTILSGFLVKDVEYSTTPNGIALARFTLAVQRKYVNADGNKECDFINIVVWRSLAENCVKYLKKGNKCAIMGSIQNRTYEDTKGIKRTVTEIVADEVEFLTLKNNGECANKKEEPEMQPINDEDLPF